MKNLTPFQKTGWFGGIGLAFSISGFVLAMWQVPLLLSIPIVVVGFVVSFMTMLTSFSYLSRHHDASREE